MSLVKCKCGKYTQNGFLCTGCQKDMSIDTLCFSPEDIESTEELDEHGFSIIDGFDYTEGHDPEDEEED